MLSDVVALVVAFVAIKMSSRKKTDKNTFGWVRSEVLGALVNAVFLLGLCFNILIEALQRIFNVEEVSDPVLVACVGSVGLLINIIGLFMFNGHGHGHSHGSGHGHSHGSGHGDSHASGHSHSNRDIDIKQHPSEKSHLITNENLPITTSNEQMNMKGVFLHIMGDALASVVVIASALSIHFIDAPWTVYIDPCISIVVVFIICFTCYPLLKEASLILLLSIPVSVNFEELRNRIEQEIPTENLHEFHVWQLSGDVLMASVHLSLDDNVKEYMRIAEILRRIFHQNGIHSYTIQPEFIVKGYSSSTDEANKTCAIGCKDDDCGDKKCCSENDNGKEKENILQSNV
ncbi:proton-coupled zinc antiporter SLC30A1-like [Antedon mediterranea]|uniref:proton-coupled zinc antiporter SLC30A1-like n=1 Tax=Antedon mediterranea TaxID=105859 RepID=UPI003AF6F805